MPTLSAEAQWYLDELSKPEVFGIQITDKAIIDELGDRITWWPGMFGGIQYVLREKVE